MNTMHTNRKIRPLAVAAALALGLGGVAETRASLLFGETFTAGNTNMDVYAGGGQSGSLSTPIGYTFTGANWQTQISGNDSVLFSNGNTASFSLAHNFTDAQHLTLSSNFTLPQGTAWIKFGSGANADFNVAGGAAFAMDSSAAVYFYDGATGVITIPGALLASNTFEIEMISSANYDGSGTVDINAWVNSVQLDLNGVAAGNTYTTGGGFTQNYVTFAQYSGGFQSWTVQDWEVAIVPEPSVLGCLGLGVGAFVMRRRRRA